MMDRERPDRRPGAGEDAGEAPQGLLFIGDPHLSSRRPGRRRDADFAALCLDKLEQGIAVANAERLLPVILGDLFDRAREEDHGVIVRTIRILRGARHRPLCLVGNHDRVHSVLSEDTALGLVREAGAVRVIDRSGPCGVITVAGVRVGLGGTPHGQPIPADVSGLFDGAEVVAWVTHHDLMFDRAYPGAGPTFAIAGCDLVVNGHMHRLEAPRRHGGTVWVNPGTILRRSIDLIDHVPAVWIWRPRDRHALEPRPLRFERDVFDLTGRLAEPIAPDAEAATRSVFAELLRAETAAEMSRTSDGSVLLEDIETLFAADRVPPEVQAIIRALHRQAVETC